MKTLKITENKQIITIVEYHLQVRDDGSIVRLCGYAAYTGIDDKGLKHNFLSSQVI